MSVSVENEFWERESWAYFERNYAGQDLADVAPSVHLVRLFKAATVLDDAASGLASCDAVLDVGCGPANNLRWILRNTAATRGVGVEVSEDTTSALRRAFPDLEFVAGDASRLPFADGEFDLVVLRGVLCWVERDRILQALGEALRVTRRYVILSDFDPARPYSTVYHHDPRHRTFKANYRTLLEATGLARTVVSLKSNEPDDWTACDTAVMVKTAPERALPVLEQTDFRPDVGSL